MKLVAALAVTLSCAGDPTQVVDPPPVGPPSPPPAQLSPLAFIWSADRGIAGIPLADGSFVGWASAINNSGEVVGWFSAGGTFPHAFIWSMRKGFRDIHPPEETTGSSHAAGINELGQVLGVTSYGWDASKSFVWTEGSPTVWITHNGDMIGHAINDRGDVVGQRIYQTGSVTRPDVAWDAFIWNAESGSSPLLSPGDYPRAVAFDINNSRQIAGSNSTMPGTMEVPVVWAQQGARPTEMVSRAENNACGISFELNYGDYACGAARTVNEKGQIAGSMRGRAFRTTQGGAIEFFPPAGPSFATAINSQGDVAGMSLGAPGGVSGQSAFVWRADGRVEWLGHLPGKTRTVATGINDLGQVVGYSQ